MQPGIGWCLSSAQFQMMLKKVDLGWYPMGDHPKMIIWIAQEGFCPAHVDHPRMIIQTVNRLSGLVGIRCRPYHLCIISTDRDQEIVCWHVHACPWIMCFHECMELHESTLAHREPMFSSCFHMIHDDSHAFTWLHDTARWHVCFHVKSRGLIWFMHFHGVSCTHEIMWFMEIHMSP